MRIFTLRSAVVLVCTLAVLADKDGAKNRDKRQHSLHQSRRSGRPPPYAVQMEPIAHYSQRDPLYNPLTADAKSDDQQGFYGESPYNYYPTEPEPIIEIIIKESNESLPTPVPPPLPPTQKKKEPIQVFYVKYEKKQEYGEDKPRVVYDTPIPALTPVEEHEEIKPDNVEPQEYAESTHQATPSPPPEPSTTLRTIIRPDSEQYHSGSSGIRVTFNTEQIPPNNHNKRSDKDAPTELIPSKPAVLPPGAPKRAHGPFAPIQSIPPRSNSGFPQQRVLNSFSQPLGPFQGPGSFQPGPPPDFNFSPPFIQQPPSPVRGHFQSIPHNQRSQQRHPITIQGLPEVQQRVPFNTFVPPGPRITISRPQQPASLQSLPLPHQNVPFQNFGQQQLPPNQTPANFNFEQNLFYKQQREQEKQRYIEQQRLLDRRQQDQKRQQEQQKQQEQYRILEQQRRKQEQEQQKLRLKQQQQQQFQQPQQQPFQFGTSQLPHTPPGGEIFKAISKLEQHYAIRENPLHPGPFPPNPQFADVSQHRPQQNNNNNQLSSNSLSVSVVPQPQQSQNSLKQHHFQQQNQQQQHQQQLQHQQQNQQQLQHIPFQLPVRQHPSSQQTTQSQQQSTFQNQQSFFLQNLPPPQQQRPQQEFQQTQGPSLSVWSRPVFQGKNANSNQKIYATPQTKTEDGSRKFSASTPNSIRYSASPPRPTAPTPTQPPPTPLTTTTTPSPRHEAKVKQNIASLPDEVPDDIREQLLSSGILGNADIQILDYDKVGGINIGDLPPEALANFYGAGGAAATGAASEPVPRIAKPKTVEAPAELQIASSSSNLVSGRARITDEVMRPGGVEMKVVHFDPRTEQGQRIAESHINENATRVRPVVVGPETQTPGQYNRYLPLKVSGASFPIPNVPELNGKKISSVVVLAPVDQSSQSGQDKDDLSSGSRYSRKIAGDVQAIKFLAGDSLKQLVKKPSADNYKRWLEQERQTEPQRQSVVLLVTSPREQSPEASADKEIFMYDVTSESVSKLAGDLSSAFVDAAESNADVDEDTSAAEH